MAGVVRRRYDSKMDEFWEGCSVERTWQRWFMTRGHVKGGGEEMAGVVVRRGHGGRSVMRRRRIGMVARRHSRNR